MTAARSVGARPVTARLRDRAGPASRLLASAVAGSVLGVRTVEPVVALTFDDGPSDGATDEVLAVLARHGVRATFFVVAAEAEARPDVVRRAVAAGHEVALHGAEHVPLGRATLRHSVDVVWRGRCRLHRLTGAPVRWFRPPFGSQNLRAYAIARAAGMQVVSWTADAWDWKPVGVEECVTRALSCLHPGAVLLLHDAAQPEAWSAFDPVSVGEGCRPAELLDRLLPALATEGYRAMPLGELVHDRPVMRAAWFTR